MSNIKNNILTSAVATIVAELVTLPICTIKTNYQNSDLGLVAEIKKLCASGIKSFYRASIPAVMSQILSTSTKYSLYRELCCRSDWKILNGAISGVLSTLVTHPFDFIKIHWQMNKSATSVIKKEGVSVIYRGYSKSFSKALIGSSLFYPLYDWSKEITGNALSASFMSVVVSTTIMQPIDYLKNRHIYGNSLYSGGVRQYFRGYSMALARIVPHFIITMMCIDTIENKLNKY